MFYPVVVPIKYFQSYRINRKVPFTILLASILCSSLSIFPVAFDFVEKLNDPQVSFWNVLITFSFVFSVIFQFAYFALSAFVIHSFSISLGGKGRFRNFADKYAMCYLPYLILAVMGLALYSYIPPDTSLLVDQFRSGTLNESEVRRLIIDITSKQYPVFTGYVRYIFYSLIIYLTACAIHVNYDINKIKAFFVATLPLLIFLAFNLIYLQN